MEVDHSKYEMMFFSSKDSEIAEEITLQTSSAVSLSDDTISTISDIASSSMECCHSKTEIMFYSMDSEIAEEITLPASSAMSMSDDTISMISDIASMECCHSKTEIMFCSMDSEIAELPVSSAIPMSDDDFSTIARLLVESGNHLAFEKLIKQFEDNEIRRLMDNECFLINFLKYKLFTEQFNDVIQIMQKTENVTNPIFLKMWDDVHYQCAEKKQGKELTAVQKFRIRQKHPPPPGLCPQGKRPNSRMQMSSKKILCQWLKDNLHDPYPCKRAKEELAKMAGLSMLQVTNWFSNARRKQRHQQHNPGMLGSVHLEIITENNGDTVIETDDSLCSSNTTVDTIKLSPFPKELYEELKNLIKHNNFKDEMKFAENKEQKDQGKYVDNAFIADTNNNYTIMDSYNVSDPLDTLDKVAVFEDQNNVHENCAFSSEMIIDQSLDEVNSVYVNWPVEKPTVILYNNCPCAAKAPTLIEVNQSAMEYISELKGVNPSDSINVMDSRIPFTCKQFITNRNINCTNLYNSLGSTAQRLDVNNILEEPAIKDKCYQQMSEYGARAADAQTGHNEHRKILTTQKKHLNSMLTRTLKERNPQKIDISNSGMCFTFDPNNSESVVADEKNTTKILSPVDKKSEMLVAFDKDAIFTTGDKNNSEICTAFESLKCLQELVESIESKVQSPIDFACTVGINDNTIEFSERTSACKENIDLVVINACNSNGNDKKHDGIHSKEHRYAILMDQPSQELYDSIVQETRYLTMMEMIQHNEELDLLTQDMSAAAGYPEDSYGTVIREAIQGLLNLSSSQESDFG